MSVGLGIFLSTLVMALLFLYAITRDRWKWKRGFRLVFLSTVAISSLAAIGITSVYMWTLDFDIWKRSFPIVQTEYWGLRLGMSMEEVQQVKGKPDVVYEVGDDGFDHFIFKDDEAKKNRGDEEFNRRSSSCRSCASQARSMQQKHRSCATIKADFRLQSHRINCIK
jgi:hypothetical protein